MATPNLISTTKPNTSFHTLPYDQVLLCDDLLLLDAVGLFGWIETVDKHDMTRTKRRPYKPLNAEEQKRLSQTLLDSSIGDYFKQVSPLHQGTVARQVLNMAYGCVQKTRLQ